MHMKSAISIFALSVGMMVVPAMAQDAKTIAGNPVLEADMVEVQAKCDELGLAANQSITDQAQDDADDDNAVTDPNAAPEDADANDEAADGANDAANSASGDTPPAEGLAQATTTIDLSAITYADCQEGGWVM